jgi:hypothetical protein
MSSSTTDSLISTLKSMGGQSNIVTVHRPFVQFTGSLESGMMLSQLLYWWDRKTGRALYKKDAEFADELCLTIYSVRQARKTLEKKGIITVEIHCANGVPTVHYILNEADLSKQWSEWITKQDFAKSQNAKSQNAKSHNVNPQNAKSQNIKCENKESSRSPFCEITKPTTETTSKTTTETTRVPDSSDNQTCCPLKRKIDSNFTPKPLDKAKYLIHDVWKEVFPHAVCYDLLNAGCLSELINKRMMPQQIANTFRYWLKHADEYVKEKGYPLTMFIKAAPGLSAVVSKPAPAEANHSGYQVSDVQHLINYLSNERIAAYMRDNPGISKPDAIGALEKEYNSRLEVKEDAAA